MFQNESNEHYLTRKENEIINVNKYEFEIGIHSKQSCYFSVMFDFVLSDFNFDFIFIYIDDLIIFSRTGNAHLIHLERVFSRLEQLYFAFAIGEVQNCGNFSALSWTHYFCRRRAT